MFTARTDLAVEIHEILTEAATELDGVSLKQEESRGIAISRIYIETEDAAEKMGREQGSYVTLDLKGQNIADGVGYENACHVLAEELQALLPEQADKTVLVAGLGNRDITPDALGPKAVSKLMVTRHLLEHIPDKIDKKIRSVCAFSPGVLGITGMETGEVIEAVCHATKPDAVVVIDALAARSMDRISTTVQLCDTGISPGAGVGNRRKALSAKTLGIPVIAVGVPTVIDAPTITADLMQAVTKSVSPDEDNRDEHLALLYQTLPEPLKQFIVTPKDVDILIDRISKVVASGINLALHPGLTLQDMEAYIS